MAGDALPSDITPTQSHPLWRIVIAVLLLLAGLVWTFYTLQNQRPYLPLESPTSSQNLVSGSVASMDSPALQYSDGWQVSSAGADPHEPVDPWVEPSGTLTFTYSGADLALNLGVGDYWGYLYITVDGQPANMLPTIRGNDDSAGSPAAYRTFYEPDKQDSGSPISQWIRVHHDAQNTDPHTARIEIWRGWGQTPLRGLAIDAMSPASPPLWPGIALILLGVGLFYPLAAGAIYSSLNTSAVSQLRTWLGWLLIPGISKRTRLLLALAFSVVTACGVAFSSWLLAVFGLAGLGLVSIARPAIWTAALVFSLPFYYSYTIPILPSRALGLIDTMVLLGFAVASASWFFSAPGKSSPPRDTNRRKLIGMLLAAIIAWALVAAFASERLAVALYEWRTVFLSAGLFAILLIVSLRSQENQRADLWLIVAAWISGAVTVAGVGLNQYASDSMLITAEGVKRVRALYGSPNNLALYLERTFLVTLALATLLPASKQRIAWILAAGVQAVALLLTFSKGSLFLGLPAGLLTLWLGGMLLLPMQGRSRRPLIWLATAAFAFALALLPFLGTERFRRLLDLSQGTGYLRVQLWRSSWQMAMDHLPFGVGPDNFLYAYRSAYLLPEAWQEPNLNHPHNWILDWWTRIGLPGLVMAMALFATGFYALWRTAKSVARTQIPEAALSLGFLAAGIGALTHGLIDASFALPDLMIVWVLILMAAIALPEHDDAHSGSQTPT